MSRSSQNGALIKNGTVIEKLAKAREIFLDKTGTITEGTIKVDSLKPIETVDEVELYSWFTRLKNQVVIF